MRIQKSVFEHIFPSLGRHDSDNKTPFHIIELKRDKEIVYSFNRCRRRWFWSINNNLKSKFSRSYPLSYLTSMIQFQIIDLHSVILNVILRFFKYKRLFQLSAVWHYSKSIFIHLDMIKQHQQCNGNNKKGYRRFISHKNSTHDHHEHTQWARCEMNANKNFFISLLEWNAILHNR